MVFLIRMHFRRFLVCNRKLLTMATLSRKEGGVCNVLHRYYTQNAVKTWCFDGVWRCCRRLFACEKAVFNDAKGR